MSSSALSAGAHSLASLSMGTPPARACSTSRYRRRASSGDSPGRILFGPGLGFGSGCGRSPKLSARAHRISPYKSGVVCFLSMAMERHRVFTLSIQASARSVRERITASALSSPRIWRSWASSSVATRAHFARSSARRKMPSKCSEVFWPDACWVCLTRPARLTRWFGCDTIGSSAVQSPPAKFSGPKGHGSPLPVGDQPAVRRPSSFYANSFATSHDPPRRS